MITWHGSGATMQFASESWDPEQVGIKCGGQPEARVGHLPVPRPRGPNVRIRPTDDAQQVTRFFRA